MSSCVYLCVCSSTVYIILCVMITGAYRILHYVNQQLHNLECKCTVHTHSRHHRVSVLSCHSTYILIHILHDVFGQLCTNTQMLKGRHCIIIPTCAYSYTARHAHAIIQDIAYTIDTPNHGYHSYMVYI